MSWPASDAELEQLGQGIIAGAGGAIADATVMYGDLTLTGPADRVTDALTYLRDGQNFQQLVDIAGADYPERPLRFDVVYHLLSLTRNLRVRLKVQTDEDTAVASAVPVYPSADWYEREAFDMYGIFFSDHPDLRRILTDYGFHGHPLRKDFPMTGYVEVRYDEALKRVVYEPVKSVEWRNWDFLSPWEGVERGFATSLLPGDEKSGEKGGA